MPHSAQLKCDGVCQSLTCNEDSRPRTHFFRNAGAPARPTLLEALRVLGWTQARVANGICVTEKFGSDANGRVSRTKVAISSIAAGIPKTSPNSGRRQCSWP
jgi:hypothetical protein